MKNSDPKCASAATLSDPAPLIRTPRQRPIGGTTSNQFTARLTIDVTPEFRGGIKVSPFERGVTMANMLCGPLAQQFPDKAGNVA